MFENSKEESKGPVDFIVECIHCGEEISKRVVYWPISQIKRFGNKSISGGICKDCLQKGKTILKD